MDERVAVIGAGSWGTALALHFANKGMDVRLWSRTPEHAELMQAQRCNPKYLREFAWPPNLRATSDLAAAVAGASLVVCSIPSHGMRPIVVELARSPADPPPCYLVASKGIEVESLANMHTVVEQELPAEHRSRVAVLGGPSFAAEVAQRLPTTVVVAAKREDVRVAIQAWLSDRALRAYVTEDVVGVELGGAFKNVIAVAAGVCDGAGLGNNARAGLITRGLAEMTRLSVALGAHPATLSGLAGMGDLVLTCTGGLSRNRRVGIALGKGQALDTILSEMGMVAEGVLNAKAAHRLAEREGVDMPIVDVVHGMLYEGLSVRDAVNVLMGRRLKAERD